MALLLDTEGVICSTAWGHCCLSLLHDAPFILCMRTAGRPANHTRSVSLKAEWGLELSYCYIRGFQGECIALMAAYVSFSLLSIDGTFTDVTHATGTDTPLQTLLLAHFSVNTLFHLWHKESNICPWPWNSFPLLCFSTGLMTEQPDATHTASVTPDATYFHQHRKTFQLTPLLNNTNAGESSYRFNTMNQ